MIGALIWTSKGRGRTGSLTQTTVAARAPFLQKQVDRRPNLGRREQHQRHVAILGKRLWSRLTRHLYNPLRTVRTWHSHIHRLRVHPDAATQGISDRRTRLEHYARTIDSRGRLRTRQPRDHRDGRSDRQVNRSRRIAQRCRERVINRSDLSYIIRHQSTPVTGLVSDGDAARYTSSTVTACLTYVVASASMGAV